jgi:hypothetical protein
VSGGNGSHAVCLHRRVRSVGATTIRPSVGLSAGRVAPDPGVSARCIHADAGVDCLDFVGSAHVTV